MLCGGSDAAGTSPALKVTQGQPVLCAKQWGSRVGEEEGAFQRRCKAGFLWQIREPRLVACGRFQGVVAAAMFESMSGGTVQPRLWELDHFCCRCSPRAPRGSTTAVAQPSRCDSITPCDFWHNSAMVAQVEAAEASLELVLGLEASFTAGCIFFLRAQAYSSKPHSPE